MKRQRFMLANLYCPSCAAKLEGAAQKLPGMISAQVTFGSGTLTVEYDETRLSEAEIREVVDQCWLVVSSVLSDPAS